MRGGEAVEPPAGLVPPARWLYPVLVSGPSMVPTLRHGDAVLVRRGGRAVRPGDVVVAVFRSRPELAVVKRAVRRQDGGWWLHGDNELITDDSRAYGVADVLGRVVFRYWPRPRRLGYRSV
ncbi:nickel-type superoxide dismutase maturation protease [Micromonospora pisi]|uniref:Nickel-type superoxide dismutase maturation protease n=1 Tax=Micromonospora pisi TaxID=589240 RepID=A0A495JIR7_9ACTN|nr:nickel-type superoxide dismutase maturation protease [Micromonospora pisi]